MDRISSDPTQDLQHSESDAQAAVENLLRSLQGNTKVSKPASAGSSQGKLYTTLPELLKPDSTVTAIKHAEPFIIDQLLSELPAQLLPSRADDSSLVSAQSRAVENPAGSLNIDEKRDLLAKALRSPQFMQSLASLTAALRDGGLPTLSEALHISVPNRGYIQQGRIPLGAARQLKLSLKLSKTKLRKRRCPTQVSRRTLIIEVQSES